MGTIVVLPKLNEGLLERIRGAAPGWQVVSGAEANEENIERADILLGWRNGLERVLTRPSSNIRWVQTWSAGVDTIDIDALFARGIELTSMNGVHAYPISETVFAMMLAFTRNLHTYIRNQATRRWHHGNLKLELHGKTLLIVGVGAIGEETARIAKTAFGMHVLGVRRSGAPAPYVDEMYTQDRMLEALPLCDYVVSCVPATAETKHLFSVAQFRAMKPSAMFVNVGRGSAVDTDALVAALKEGRIAGAGLDVFEREPLPDDHPLWTMDNVIVTPHSAGSSEHYASRGVEIFLTNLEAVLDGRPPSVNRVDPVNRY